MGLEWSCVSEQQHRASLVLHFLWAAHSSQPHSHCLRNLKNMSRADMKIAVHPDVREDAADQAAWGMAVSSRTGQLMLALHIFVQSTGVCSSEQSLHWHRASRPRQRPMCTAA